MAGNDQSLGAFLCLCLLPHALEVQSLTVVSQLLCQELTNLKLLLFKCEKIETVETVKISFSPGIFGWC